jgi:hypothetical protein
MNRYDRLEPEAAVTGSGQLGQCGGPARHALVTEAEGRIQVSGCKSVR